MSRKPQTPEEVLAKTNDDLVCALGEQSGLSWRFTEEGQERSLLPIRTMAPSRPGPYPEAFYRAQKWLRRNRRVLQRYIVETLDYGAKRDSYGRGREAQLVADLASEKVRSLDCILNRMSPIFSGINVVYIHPRSES